MKPELAECYEPKPVPSGPRMGFYGAKTGLLAQEKRDENFDRGPRFSNLAYGLVHIWPDLHDYHRGWKGHAWVQRRQWSGDQRRVELSFRRRCGLDWQPVYRR